VSLTISYNCLTSLPSTLPSLLQVFDVSHNALTSIPPSLVASLPSLVSLNVAHNRLSHLPPLHALTSLQILNLSHNYLTALSALPMLLCSVELSHNELTTLPEPSLCASSSLTRLALDNNCLSELPVALASTPLRLCPAGLSISGNPLAMIPGPFRSDPVSVMGYLGDLLSGVEQVCASWNALYHFLVSYVCVFTRALSC
jgi:Leucine-rich repeat (LRR) protein